MSVASTFIPYTVPVKAVIISNKPYPFFVTQLVTTSNSSEDDTTINTIEKSLDETSPSDLKMTGKKRRRNHRNSEEHYAKKSEKKSELEDQKPSINSHQENLNTHIKTQKSEQKKIINSYSQKNRCGLHPGEQHYKCDVCQNEYFDLANYKYHMKTHPKSNEKDKKCLHSVCQHSFKTKKQKLLHHDKLNEQCKSEKASLLRLLKLFKNVVEELVGKCDKDDSFHLDFSNLLKEEENIKKYILDTSQYESMIFEKGTCC